MTPHSVKYWAKEIQAREGIHFEFHKLRKTHLSYLAGMNVPAIELMKRAGHKKYDTSMKYYINRSEESKQYLLNTIDRISLTAPKYHIYFDPERKFPFEIPEDVANNILAMYGQIPKAYDNKAFTPFVEVVDDGGGILPPVVQNVAVSTASPENKQPESQGSSTGFKGITSKYGDYKPISIEDFADAMTALGRKDIIDDLLETTQTGDEE